MSICPKCKGEGEFFWDDHCQGMFMECDMCNGTGEVEMTNEEWMRSATFEELAGAIYEWHSAGYTKGRLELGLNPITEIVEWLKEKHDG